jgi:hypothetical protein
MAVVIPTRSIRAAAQMVVMHTPLPADASSGPSSWMCWSNGQRAGRTLISAPTGLWSEVESSGVL